MTTGEHSELPAGWTLVRLEELAASEPNALTDGPFGSNLKTEHYRDSGPRVIRLQNVSDGAFLDSAAHIDTTHFERLRRYEAKEGDVTIAILGDPLPRACLIPARLGPAIVKADCVRLRVDQRLVAAAFAMYAVNSEQTRRRASDAIHGVGRPRLNLRDLRNIEIPLAPRAEQDRIVDALDTNFTRLGAALAALERVQTNLNRYRASVLQAAVEGRLVPTEAELARREGRDYEPASKLLERIVAERRRRWEQAQLVRMKAKGKIPSDERWKARYKAPLSPNAEGLPDLPEGWCWASADQITTAITDGEHITPERSDSGVLLLSARNILDGALSLEHVDHIPERVYDTLSKKLTINEGDVLLSCSGSVGRSCVAPPNLRFSLVRSVAVLKPLFEMGAFLSFALRSLFLQSQINEKKTQTAQSNIFQGKIRTLMIPLPPLAEQRRINDQVAASLCFSEAILSYTRAAGARAERLRQAILKSAFEGKLVDQDSADECAAALLERIRAESDAAQSAALSSKGQRPRGKRTAA